MGKRLAWFGATVIALGGIVMGAIPIEIGPRWLWLLIGIGFGLAAAFTFLPVWRSPSEQSDSRSSHQRIKSGDNSRIIQSSGDVDLRGGMGDHK